MTSSFYATINDLRGGNVPFAVATVVETLGSSSAKTGAKALIDEHGELIAGWVGGGCAESTVRQTAVGCLQNNQSTIIDIDLEEEIFGVGMPCGGSMRVFIEPMVPEPTLWILGRGSIAETLCQLGSIAGLRVVVHGTSANTAKYRHATKIITDDRGYSALTPGENDFAVVATQHKGDHKSLQVLLQSEVRYIALIASAKRAELIIEYLKGAGYEQAVLARLAAPAGLDLGAQTPEEIAISIAAEIIMLRRNASGQRKSLTGVAASKP